MMVINGLGVDNTEADVGAPEGAGGPNTSRGVIENRPHIPKPGSAVSNCVTLGKSLNLAATISASRKVGLLIPPRARDADQQPPPCPRWPLPHHC